MEATLFLEVFTRKLWGPIRTNGMFMGRDEGCCYKDDINIPQRYLDIYIFKNLDFGRFYIKSSYYVLLYCFIFLPLNCNKETCIEFLESSPKSMYNCYKLLGFDVLVDNNLKVIPELGNLDSVYFEVNEINLHIFPYQWHMKYRSVNIILSEIKVHLMEVNARPQLQDDLLDKAVNRPMVCVSLRTL